MIFQRVASGAVEADSRRAKVAVQPTDKWIGDLKSFA